jgi:hypothetical protein
VAWLVGKWSWRRWCGLACLPDCSAPCAALLDTSLADAGAFATPVAVQRTQSTNLRKDSGHAEHCPAAVHPLALCKPLEALLVCPKAQRVKSKVGRQGAVLQVCGEVVSWQPVGADCGTHNHAGAGGTGGARSLGHLQGASAAGISCAQWH